MFLKHPRLADGSVVDGIGGVICRARGENTRIVSGTSANKGLREIKGLLLPGIYSTGYGSLNTDHGV